MVTKERRRLHVAARADEMKGTCDGCSIWGENQVDSTGKARKKLDRYQLLEYSALPQYLKDNEYIRAYYRADFPLNQALYSLFTIHNETLNIWTHLVGFFLFLGLTILAVLELQKFEMLAQSSMRGSGLGINNSELCCVQAVKEDTARTVLPALKPTSRFPFFVFLGGSMFCLLASSVFHLLTCHSEALATLFMRLDYAGISVMISTSFFPPIYYMFLCTPMWQIIYLTSISLIGISVVAILFYDSWQHRAYRAMLFLSMGFSGIIPSLHGAALYWNEPLCLVAVAHEAAMGVLYGFGALFYVTRIPERWKPGWFDLGGHSHNIFHVMVIAGAYTHYRAALIFLEWRDSTGCNA